MEVLARDSRKRRTMQTTQNNRDSIKLENPGSCGLLSPHARSYTELKVLYPENSVKSFLSQTSFLRHAG